MSKKPNEQQKEERDFLLKNLGLAECYSQIMWEQVREMLTYKPQDLPGFIEHLKTIYTDEFVERCVVVYQLVKDKVFK